MSHHQSQACAAAGAEGAQEKPVRIARVVIRAQVPAELLQVNRNSLHPSCQLRLASMLSPESGSNSAWTQPSLGDGYLGTRKGDT
jgi:hypothetical protein